MITIDVNGASRQIDIEPDTPLLWVLRDVIGLTGTKFGCRIAQCGACTVHIDGTAMRSCSVPIGALDSWRLSSLFRYWPMLELGGRFGQTGHGRQQKQSRIISSQGRPPRKIIPNSA